MRNDSTLEIECDVCKRRLSGLENEYVMFNKIRHINVPEINIEWDACENHYGLSIFPNEDIKNKMADYYEKERLIEQKEKG